MRYRHTVSFATVIKMPKKTKKLFVVDSRQISRVQRCHRNSIIQTDGRSVPRNNLTGSATPTPVSVPATLFKKHNKANTVIQVSSHRRGYIRCNSLGPLLRNESLGSNTPEPEPTSDGADEFPRQLLSGGPIRIGAEQCRFSLAARRRRAGNRTS
jgi:hypothetical protein